ncbi:N-acetylmuramoyl-L-alanine amidase [Paeniglutamicibacter gangotriensis]|uniref:N-acetylmuramoyl-L-alanine amidase n=1 Tax=Paeniglutamicibacter gangotriensis TaxID=254787 RepID=UPI0037C5CE6A
MAIYPGAKKRLIDKWNKVKITRHRRVNLHVAVSEAESLFGMFSRSNSACSHFYVAKDGTVEQYIDTAYRSGADMNGNDSTISVETQGGVRDPEGEPWTAAQVIALVALWKWARDRHKIKNQVAINTQTNDNSAGLSWHRLGVEGNFAGRKGILSKSYKPGGIKFSSARGKICPGDAKILQIPGIWEAANGKLPAAGKVTPVAKPKPKPKPAKDKSGAWPEKPLKVTDKHTVESDAAWRELMDAIGYDNKSLGKNLQTWLSELEDPRTGRGYYDTAKWRIDGDFSNESVKALQRKLYDTEDDNGKRLYNGKADGGRGGMTVRAEVGYLNLKANRGIK